MRQQALKQPEPVGLPVAPAHGVAEVADDAQPARTVEAREQALLAAGAEQELVVGRRRLPLVFGIEVGGVDQSAVGKPPDAGHRFVVRVVDLEILAQPLLDTLAARESAGEVQANVVAEPLADDQGVPDGADGLLDQHRGGGPAGVVEGGLVQQAEATLESLVRVHAACPRRRGPADVNRSPDC